MKKTIGKHIDISGRNFRKLRRAKMAGGGGGLLNSIVCDHIKYPPISKRGAGGGEGRIYLLENIRWKYFQIQ
jgi:hypothetical protein